MVYPADSPRRSSVKRRGSKRLTVEAADQPVLRRVAGEPFHDGNDSRREGPRGGRGPRRLVREAGGA